MSTRTLTLTAWQVTDLRQGNHVDAVDSDERPVTVWCSDVRSARPEGAGYPLLDLSLADLDMVGKPEGLVVADAERKTGWTVRVAEVAR